MDTISYPNTHRNTAIIVGILFLLSTTAFMVGDGMITTVVQGSEYLKNVYPNKSQLVSGVLLQLINCIAVVGIGFLMLPVLKPFNEKMGLAYFSSRVIEGVLLIITLVGLLLIIPLSKEYLQTNAADVAWFTTVGTLLKTGRYLLFQMAMVSLSFGSLFLCYLLYRFKLVPRILTILGFIGYGLLLIKMIIGFYGYGTKDTLMYIPGALFELILPIWLLVKGFSPAAFTAEND